MAKNNGVLERVKEKIEISRIVKEAKQEIDYRIETMQKKYATIS